ncbi:ATP-dependent RNA helicase DbpA [Ferrimonas lipolytica]|uniref:ATP-dependent RNA helicase DbpA n=1 Tax=Ferrimonas lipolytica TaxID=2724191 RepID=A0A6H1UIM1_9GAMM|nr:ATP-dependent RNA helicase DbpA [Ferrimonas lipolytica]
MVTSAFTSLPLSKPCVDNLNQLGFTEMTPIQAQALPAILRGDDVVGQAKTGSGKTVAFGLGLLSHLDPKRMQTQALVLCPTRELADQVTKVLRQLARAWPNVKILTLCGGMPMRAQTGSLEHGCHIAVGTPGRIRKHLENGNLHLDRLETLVLDEADRMLDMGFEDDINAIMGDVPHQRQTLLFSATYPTEIEAMTAKVQSQPVMVKIDSEPSNDIEQSAIELSPAQKPTALLALLAQHQPESTVVFCNTRIACQNVADDLHDAGVSVLELHGDLDQQERDRTLVRFSNKSASVLVATDVAARGLDIKSLAMVVNYDIAFEPEVHVHRVGRTGRAGEQGVAVSLCSGNETKRLLAIEDLAGVDIPRESFDSLNLVTHVDLTPPMMTISIGAGRKSKMRPGDILGALTADKTLSGKVVGNIHVGDRLSYVAIEREHAKNALHILQRDKIKGRNLIVKLHK